jgi:hypothetical protein
VAGNFNADVDSGTAQGLDDLAIGAWLEDIVSVSNAGAATALYDTTSFGMQASSPNDQFWNQDATIGGNVEDVSETDDRFGFDMT